MLNCVAAAFLLSQLCFLGHALHSHHRQLAQVDSLRPHQPSDQTPFVIAAARKLSVQHDEEIKFDLDGTFFFSPNIPSATVTGQNTSLFQGAAYIPVTLVAIPVGGQYTGRDLSALIGEYLETDDVLSTAWLSTVVLVTDAGTSLQTNLNISVTDEASLRTELGVERILLDSAFQLETDDDHLRSIQNQIAYKTTHDILSALRGPFLAKQTSEGAIDLLPVYRLHSDVYRTFLFGMYPTLPGSYKELRAVDVRGYNLIPVPSRLYSECHADDGVCGARIAVKDLYDVQGVTTSAGSRAWGELRGKAPKSASSIQRLADLGGVLVGKTKTASFAMGAMGTEETVDEQYTRGSLAELPWFVVWFSLCYGSIRMARHWYRIRHERYIGRELLLEAMLMAPYALCGPQQPSLDYLAIDHGVLPLDGVVPEVDRQDTAGMLVRDPNRLSGVTRAWYAESPLNLLEYTQLPSRIIVETNFGKDHTEAAYNITETFLQEIHNQLGIEIQRMDIENPLIAAGWSWNRFVEELLRVRWTWFSWVANGKSLYDWYASVNDGRSPPTDPVVRRGWRGVRDSNMTQKEWESVAPKMQEFAVIINDDLLGQDEASCSKNIFIYDFGTGGRPVYRERHLNTDSMVRGIFTEHRPINQMCSVAGCVDVTIPIGQVPYMSAVSEHEEMAPVTVSVVARKGCDFMVADFVDRLAEFGLISNVKTGHTPY